MNFLRQSELDLKSYKTMPDILWALVVRGKIGKIIAKLFESDLLNLLLPRQKMDLLLLLKVVEKGEPAFKEYITQRGSESLRTLGIIATLANGLLNKHTETKITEKLANLMSKFDDQTFCEVINKMAKDSELYMDFVNSGSDSLEEDDLSQYFS